MTRNKNSRKTIRREIYVVAVLFAFIFVGMIEISLAMFFTNIWPVTFLGAKLSLPKKTSVVE